MENELNLYEVWKQTLGETSQPAIPATYLNENELVIAYKGDISETFLQTVFKKTEEQLSITEQDTRVRKRVYNIVVECLQNIFQHSENENIKERKFRDETNSAIFIVFKNSQSGIYKIFTGNFMQNVYCGPLTERIRKVNAMLPGELRAHYIESLGSTEFSEKGGAGLGIIDIARKSGNQLIHKFDKYSDTYCFFTLIVTVNSTEQDTNNN